MSGGFAGVAELQGVWLAKPTVTGGLTLNQLSGVWITGAVPVIEAEVEPTVGGGGRRPEHLMTESEWVDMIEYEDIEIIELIQNILRVISR